MPRGGGIWPGDITIIEAVNGFRGWTHREDTFMPFPLELSMSFIPDRFRRKVAELAGVAVEELPLARTEVKEIHGTYYDFLLFRIVDFGASS